MSMTVNSFYLLIPLHFFFQSVTIDNVYFDGLLRLRFPHSLFKLQMFPFLSGGRFVIRHVF